MSISEVLVKRYFEAMETGDDALFDEVYAEEAVFYTPFSYAVRGRFFIKMFAVQFRQGFPGARMALHDEFTSADGTRACFRIVLHWHNTGSYFGHAATQLKGRTTETHTVRIEDERIVEHWVGVNTLPLTHLEAVTWEMDFAKDAEDPQPEILVANVPA
jgi:ketosteroid isomerase-like protein